MAERQSRVQLNDAISGDKAEQFATDLQHHKSQQAIKLVVKDYVGSTEFEKTIQDIIKDSLEKDSVQDQLTKWFDRNFDTRLSDHSWKNKTFWIPTVIAIAAVVVAFFRH